MNCSIRLAHEGFARYDVPRMPSTRLIISWPQLVTSAQETRGCEFKPPGPWDNLKHRIARTALGLANLRDGGFVVIGLSQRANGDFIPEGLSQPDLDSFVPDVVQDFVNSFATSSVSLRCDRMAHDGKTYVVIEVDQFSKIPIISRKDSPPGEVQGVRKDVLYARTIAGRPSTRAATAEDLLEIVALAVELGLKEHVERTDRAGLMLTLRKPGEADRFREERGAL